LPLGPAEIKTKITQILAGFERHRIEIKRLAGIQYRHTVVVAMGFAIP
jgi:hypothetical protein